MVGVYSYLLDIKQRQKELFASDLSVGKNASGQSGTDQAGSKSRDMRTFVLLLTSKTSFVGCMLAMCFLCNESRFRFIWLFEVKTKPEVVYKCISIILNIICYEYLFTLSTYPSIKFII